MTSSRPLGRPVLITLGLVGALWPLTMDLYLPAFPRIASEFGAGPGPVQLTLTSAFIGMAIGQLVAGPVSDAIGRRVPLVTALVVYAAATAACCLAPTIGALIAARLVQGAGAAAGSVIALACVRDVSSGAGMVRLTARLQLVNGFFVVASPALGAVLLAVTDWRGLFAGLIVVGAVLAAVCAVVLRGRDTTPPPGRSPARLGRNVRALASDRRFLALLAAGALVWGAMMSYMSASSFLFQEDYGLSPAMYAVVFGGHGALMIVAAQGGARMSQRGLERLLRRGGVALASVGCVLVLSLLAAPRLGLAGFVVPLLCFVAAFGAIQPVIQAAALRDHPERAATAASWLGSVNMVVGAVVSPLVGLIGLSTALPAAVFMFGLSAAGAGVLLRLPLSPPGTVRCADLPEGGAKGRPLHEIEPSSEPGRSGRHAGGG
jgi:DHA1 family bicyclomycin/chloramphenicol resistance-like MFS transporter